MSASRRRSGWAGWALAGLSIAALGGAVAAYGYYALDWGCPSNAELQRPYTEER